MTTTAPEPTALAIGEAFQVSELLGMTTPTTAKPDPELIYRWHAAVVGPGILCRQPGDWLHTVSWAPGTYGVTCGRCLAEQAARRPVETVAAL